MNLEKVHGGLRVMFASLSAVALLASVSAVDAAEEPSEEATGLEGAVYVEPLGLLLFGPSLGVELGSGYFSGLAYVRWMDGGALARSLFPSDDEEFAFSYGIGLRGRHYFQPHLNGPYLGLGVEYLSTRIESPKQNLIATNTQYLVPQLDGGYRFRFGGFFAGPSAALGYALEVSSEVENLPGGSNAHLFEASDESTVYGSIMLELGAYF